LSLPLPATVARLAAQLVPFGDAHALDAGQRDTLAKGSIVLASSEQGAALPQTVSRRSRRVLINPRSRHATTARHTVARGSNAVTPPAGTPSNAPTAEHQTPAPTPASDSRREAPPDSGGAQSAPASTPTPAPTPTPTPDPLPTPTPVVDAATNTANKTVSSATKTVTDTANGVVGGLPHP
jgi:hypothetical protein